jgi:hypothetical protein
MTLMRPTATLLLRTLAPGASAASACTSASLEFVRNSVRAAGARSLALKPRAPPSLAPDRRSIYDTQCGGVWLNGAASAKPVRVAPSSSSSPLMPASTPMPRSDDTFLPLPRTQLARGIFDEVGVPVELFEGNAKDVWIDGAKGWCHLCSEPVGVAPGTHIGDRDHANMAVYLHLLTIYPRHWAARDVLADALTRFPRLAVHVLGAPHSVDHLHTRDDTARRAELEALLLHLCSPPHRGVAHALQGRAPQALWVAGERIFKTNVLELVAKQLPPMSAGIHTAFTQKVWSRTNLERMYDALNIARIHRSFGAEPKKERLEKAFFMRALFWELHAALDVGEIASAAASPPSSPSSSDAVGVPVSPSSSPSEGDTSAPDAVHESSPDGGDSASSDGADAVTVLLLRECLRRMSFELAFLQSMIYMNRAQDVARKLGGPSWAELEALDAL